MRFYDRMNVINVDMLERELRNAAVYAEHPTAKAWVMSVARNFMLSGLTAKDAGSIYLAYSPPRAGKHSDLPPVRRLPEWAQKALTNGTELHWFDYLQARRRPIWQCLEHIIHWFNAWEKDDPRWNGERTTRICWHTASREAAMWFKDVNENLWDYVKDKPPIIRAYEQGYRWVRLSTALHFERESRLMGHCVGNGTYFTNYVRGETEYYSLRDEHNKPHVTVEVRKKRGSNPAAVMQCKGRSNGKPLPEYQRYIRRFFNDQKWAITGDESNID